MSRIDATRHHEDDPLKWKKHLVLVEWKIRDKTHLLDSINRYSIQNYMECIDDIRNEFENLSGEYTFIVKLVYRYNFWKLPNIVITSKQDLIQAKRTIDTYDKTFLSEIWYCKNNTENYNTVFGRMLISNNQLFPDRCPIRYELVWSTSARNIERYPIINCPFIAVERSNWNAKPEFREINDINMHSIDMISISEKIIKSISLYTSKIKEFGCYVFSRGCNHLCLEFSFCNGELNFIDWDTDDDNKILCLSNEGNVI